MYKQDLALDNQQWLICHKNDQTEPSPHSSYEGMVGYSRFSSLGKSTIQEEGKLWIQTSFTLIKKIYFL